MGRHQVSQLNAVVGVAIPIQCVQQAHNVMFHPVGKEGAMRQMMRCDHGGTVGCPHIDLAQYDGMRVANRTEGEGDRIALPENKLTMRTGQPLLRRGVIAQPFDRAVQEKSIKKVNLGGVERYGVR